MKGEALMSSTGGWSLFVPLLGSVADWPEYLWPKRACPPTPAERAAALTALGYEAVPGAEWEWTETSRDLGDPRQPVELIASIPVRPLPGEGM